MAGIRLEADEQTVLYVILNGLQSFLRAPLFQKHPQTITQVLEYGTIIQYATFSDPIITLPPTIKVKSNWLLPAHHHKQPRSPRKH